MKMRVILSFLSLSLLLACAPQKPRAHSQINSNTEGSPVAVINSEKISYREYEERLRSLPTALSIRLSSETERQLHLNELGQFEVLADAAEREGFADRAIVRNEIDDAIVSDSIATYIRAEELTEKVLKEAWERKKSQFLTPEKRRVAAVFCPTKEICEDLLNRVNAVTAPAERMELFFSVAARHSIDRGTGRRRGDMGWLSKDTNDDPIRSAIFRLDSPGQIAGPVESGDRWAIALFRERRPEEQMSFEQSRETIRNEALTKLRAKVRQDKVQSLRASAKIQIDDGKVAHLKPPAARAASEN
jgi:parvulin-like peptidyl-prolyl isomerase